MGSQRAIAGRVSRGVDHTRREARVGEEHGRCVPGAARRRDGFGAASARTGAKGRQPEIERAGQGVDAGVRASPVDDGRATSGAAAASDRDRAGATVGRLRAGV